MSRLSDPWSSSAYWMRTGAAEVVLLTFGDSLTVLSELAAHLLLGQKYTLVVRANGGSAICNYLAEGAFDAAYHRPSRVVIANTGNNLSDCSSTTTCEAESRPSSPTTAAPSSRCGRRSRVSP